MNENIVSTIDIAENYIIYIEWPISLLSILSSLIVIFIFLLYKEVRCYAFEQIVYLIIACIGNTIAYLIKNIASENSIIDDRNLCQTQAFIIVWLELSQMFWTTLIAYSVYENVICFDLLDSKKTSMFKRASHIFIGFILPLSVPVLGLFLKVLGANGRKWCWIIHDKSIPETYIYSILVYSIYWILLVFNFVISCFVIRYLSKIQILLDGNKKLISRCICKLIQFPIIQMVCLLPSTINTFLYLFGEYNSYLDSISIIFRSVQGLIYSIAYGYNPQVRLTFNKCLCRLFCCKKSKNNDNSKLEIGNSFIKQNISDYYGSFISEHSVESLVSEDIIERKTNFLNK